MGVGSHLGWEYPIEFAELQHEVDKGDVQIGLD